MNWFRRSTEIPDESEVTDVAPLSKADVMRSALAEKEKDEPAWVAPLRAQLQELCATIENNTLDQHSRRVTLVALKDVQDRIVSTGDSFDALARFVESGRACPDCRESRQKFIAKLLEALADAGKNSPASNPGQQYATRENAYQSGWFACARSLANTVELMNSEYLNGEKQI